MVKNFKSRNSRPADPSPGVDEPQDRIPPHNQDAEQGLLASVILEGGGEILAICREHRLTPKHFFNTAHQIIYEAMLSLAGDGKSVDEITIANHLNNTGELRAIGGPAYLNELTRRIEVTAHAVHWLEIIKEKFVIRQVIATARTAIEQAYRPGNGSEALLEGVSAAFFELTHSAGDPVEDAGQTLVKIKHRFNEAVAGRATEDFQADRISWGFPCLDRRFKPLCARKGDFLVGVFGPPGHGKSSIVDNLLACALEQGKCVIKHSLETSNEATLLSLAALSSGIPMSAADDPAALAALKEEMKNRRVTSLTPEESAAGASFFDKQQRVAENAWEKAVRIQNEYIDFLTAIQGKTFFTYDHTQEFTDLIATTRDAVRKMAKEGRKPDLLVIDYLQEIELRRTEKEQLRSDEILDRIARQTKKLAKQLKIPAILIASLNNAGTEGTPSMKHIRGSGGISFILDRAVSVYRPDETKDKMSNRLTDTHHTVEVFVEQFNKRNNPGWREKMNFHGPTKRFSDISRFTSPAEQTRLNHEAGAAMQERIENRGRPKGVKNGEGRMHQREAPKFAHHDDRPWTEGG